MFTITITVSFRSFFMGLFFGDFLLMPPYCCYSRIVVERNLREFLWSLEFMHSTNADTRMLKLFILNATATETRKQHHPYNVLYYYVHNIKYAHISKMHSQIQIPRLFESAPHISSPFTNQMQPRLDVWYCCFFLLLSSGKILHKN